MTLTSMTGFGRAQGELSSRFAASVVIRSVNSKYLDVVVRTSVRDEVPELEAAVRAVVAGGLERGRVTVQVDLQQTVPQTVRVVVNADAVASAGEQLAALSLPGCVGSGVGLGELLAIPGLVTVESVASQLEPVEVEALAEVTARAVAALASMRREEGAVLEGHVRNDLAVIRGFVDWFEPQAGKFRSLVFDRLRDRLAELTGQGSGLDPDRQVQEAALLADRADVTEEVVRLRSHLAGFVDRLDGGGAVGRTLDFMCQEILRELNTLGSKCREVGVAERLVDAKAALERVREQVQNLE
jgi:uncharacterized protein (TIGR00255 family)